MKIMTAKEINKKYAGKYVDVYKRYDGEYEVRKVFSEIHENTSRGEDIGTEMAYRR